MTAGRAHVGGTVVITGAASGIGRRAAAQLTATGFRTVAVARSQERARDVVASATASARHGGSIVVVPADLADLAQVRAAAARIRDMGPIAALINNAAVFDLSRTQARITVDGIEETFAVNHVAPFVLTHELGPALAGDAVVVTAASKGLIALPRLRLDPQDLDSRNDYRPTRAYYRSKIAQLLFTAELARRGTGAVALRIPSVRVDDDKLRGYPARLRAPYRVKSLFAADPSAIAAQYLGLAAGPPAATARYVDERGHDVRWTNQTADPRLAALVWGRTAALAGVTPT
jgi:NAD(P)-dependent dehydrogenase (short-subunit alcohol dehydrogenase family)